jgi:hypothetical protein
METQIIDGLLGKQIAKAEATLSKEDFLSWLRFMIRNVERA